MVNEKYLTLEGLTQYTEKIKEKIKEVPVGTFVGNFPTKAQLDAWDGIKVKNDYAVVDKDETPAHLDKTTRYRFDGTNWEFEYVIENNDCIKLLPKEPGSGQDYKFPFNINAIVQEASQITTSFDTLVLNDGVTKNTFPVVIPSADPTNNKAGLYNKTLADAKANVVDVVPKADIVDNLSTADATKVLSANQGKELNDRYNSLSGMGRYLSTWDCTTGKPTTNPPGGTPYTYKTGDYYIVSKVGTTNYVPTGTQYDGNPSTTTTTDTIAVNDTYRFDSNVWALLHTEIPTTSFASIAGNATDNPSLKGELDKKLDIKTDASRVQSVYVSNQDGTQALEPVASAETDGGIAKMQLARKYVDDKIYNGLDKTSEGFILDARQGKALKDSVDGKISLLGTETGSGEEYHFPYYYDIQPKSDGIYISMKTITLDNKKTLASADFTVPQAIVEATTELPNGMAGLYTKALADEKVSLLGNEAGSGEPYHFTYFYTVTPEAEQVKVGIETITLDNNRTLKHYEMPIVKMDYINNKAGLYTKSLADAKTDRVATIAEGKSLVTNLANDGGACMKFEHTDGTWSGIAVNNGGKSGICAQIYAVSSTNPSGECMKINVKKSGIYYMKNKASGSETDDDEIATKGDISKAGNRIRRETLDGEWGYTFTLSSENKCIVQVYDNDGVQIIPHIVQEGNVLKLEFTNGITGTAVILE